MEATKTFYAVCNQSGPISVRLTARTLDAAIEEVARYADEEPRYDAEDDCKFCGEGMNEEEFAAAIKKHGLRPVRDLDPVHNYHAGRTAHLLGGWYLWVHESD